MSKKIVSLLLALVLCLGLSVPAMADGLGFDVVYNVEGGGLREKTTDDSISGDGWSFDAPSNTLTLNNVKGVASFSVKYMNGKQPTLVLTAGSKNVIDQLTYFGAGHADDALTIKGSGELILHPYDRSEDDRFSRGVFTSYVGNIIFEDRLTATGGQTPEDNSPLTLTPCEENSATFNTYLFNNQPAKYIRIAPGTGSNSQTTALPVTVAGFTDVAVNSPYANAILWAVKENVTTGITATTFGPSNICTASHILTFLYRVSGSPNKSDDERASVIAWAKTKGISVSNLDAPCTRAMAVEYMWKAAGSPSPEHKNIATFRDVPANATYTTAVYWARERGITVGTSDNAFSPNNTCTRGQIVTFLYRTGGYMFRAA